jgi:hypothetical protein
MRKRNLAAAAAIAALVATTWAAGPAQAKQDPVPFGSAQCAALTGLELSSKAIDLPTTGAVVTEALWMQTPANGQCRVKGSIHPVDPAAPVIGFQVNLPSNWNGRALQMGGGGLNGTLVTGLTPYRNQPPGQPTPLEQGFVTLGSDGGHQGPGGSFALNDEALLNYGQQSIKKTHDVAMALMEAAYNDDPDYFYFIGFSRGGHEALDAAARYSKDYDGVVAGTPTYNVTMMHAGHGSVYRDALYANGGAGWVNPAKQALLVDAVYSTCDPIDGIADGIISDTEGCLDAFDVQTLRCAGGADLGNTCLSDAQIATLNTLASDNDLGFDIAGNSIAAAFPVYNGGLLGTEYGTGLFGRYHLGLTQVPHNPATSQDAWHYQVGDTNAKWFVTKNPTLDYLDFDLHAYQDRVQELGTIMDTTDVSFQQAFAKKTKVLMYTGMADDGVSPYNTIQLYDRIVADLGQKKVDSFLRFYTIPGMSHGFGPFVAGWDSLTALRNWVENGVAPGPQTIVDTNVATANRTRPLCQYPTWPQYIGGDPNAATSFSCVP